MHNVEGVRSQKLAHSHARCSWYCRSSSSRAQELNTTKAGVGFYAYIAAQTWVNCPRVLLDLLSVLPPLPYRNVEGAPVP